MTQARTSLGAHWPLFGLRLQVADLELRIPDDRDLAALLEVAAAGVHAPEQMPFVTPWTDAPPGTFERGFLQYHWGVRSRWTPSAWCAEFAVSRDGVLMGCQSLAGEDFPVTRSVTTGSWLGQRFQGQGVGTLMRTAVLALAFEGLGALEARSGAFTDNPASAAVSRNLGYHSHGSRVHVRRGERALEQHYLLTREAWAARSHTPVEIAGLGACRDWFGASAA